MLMGGAPGDPSLWSASKSEGAVSAWVESVVETSGGCKFDSAKEIEKVKIAMSV